MITGAGRIILQVVLVAMIATGVAAVNAQVISIKENILIDGKLSEPAWSAAPVHDDFSPLKHGKTISNPVRTEFRVLHDEKNLYIGIKCLEPFMDKLAELKDGPLWYVDGVEIFMAPTGMSDEYYQFLVTAGNRRWCMFHGESGNIRPDPYAPMWESATFKGENFWSVEIKIPLSGLYMTPSGRWKNEWLFNVARNRRMVRELYSWSKLESSFRESARFRELGPFPLKKASDDIYIRSARVEIAGPREDAYQGSVTFAVEAAAEAAGKYEFVCTVPEPRKSYTATVELKSGHNQFVVPDVVFAAIGKADIHCELISAKTSESFARHYPVDVAYNPMRMEFTSPGYRQTFYPGQSRSVVSGKIHLNLTPEQMRDGQVEMSIAGPGVPLRKQTMKTGGDTLEFSFDTPGLDFGKTELKTVVVCGGKQVAGIVSVIDYPKPIDNKMVWIENSKIIIDGQPVFPCFIYATYWRGGAAFKKKFDAEFENLFLTPELRCVLEPFRLVPGIEQKEATQDVRPSQIVFDKIAEAMDRMKGRDFIFYYLSDEPDLRGVSPVYLRYLYEFIKERDPFHPVMITSLAPRRFIDSTDIVVTHPYIRPTSDGKGGRFLARPLTNVRNYTRELAEAKRPDKVTGIMPQLFSFVYDNVMALYPTFDELEANVWCGIADGARTVYYCAYNDLGDRPAFYDGLRYIHESIKMLDHLLLSDNKLPVSATDPENRLSLMLLEENGITMLAMVNLEDSAVTTTVTAPQFEKLNRLFQFRSDLVFKVEDDSLNLELAPYEVKVLTSEKVDAGLRSRAEAAAMIAAAERARGERGNILFERGLELEVDSSSPSPRSSLGEKNKLFNGTTDVLGWQHARLGEAAWYELSFPKFVPRFSKVRLFGHNVKGAGVKIWKAGEWLPLKPQKTEDGEYMVAMDYGDTLSTVKIRFDFPAPPRTERVELYEIELLK